MRCAKAEICLQTFPEQFSEKDIRKISQENFSEEILRNKFLRKTSENHEIFMNFHDFTLLTKRQHFHVFGKCFSFYQGFIRAFETFSKYAVLLYVFNGVSSDFLTETSSGQGAVAPEIFLRNVSEVFCRKLFRKSCRKSFQSENPKRSRRSFCIILSLFRKRMLNNHQTPSKC